MTLYALNRPEKEKSTSSRMPLCYQITGFWGGGGHTIWPLASLKAVTLTNSPGQSATLAQFVFCSIIRATQKSRRLVKTCQMCHRCRRSQSFISSSAKRTDLFFFGLFLSLSSHPFFVFIYISRGLRWGWADRVGRWIKLGGKKRNKFGSARAVLVMLPFVRRLVFGSGSSPSGFAVSPSPTDGSWWRAVRGQGFIRHPRRWDQKQITGIDLLTAARFLFLIILASHTERSTATQGSDTSGIPLLNIADSSLFLVLGQMQYVFMPYTAYV